MLASVIGALDRLQVDWRWTGVVQSVWQPTVHHQWSGERQMWLQSSERRFRLLTQSKCSSEYFTVFYSKKRFAARA